MRNLWIDEKLMNRWETYEDMRNLLRDEKLIKRRDTY